MTELSIVAARFVSGDVVAAIAATVCITIAKTNINAIANASPRTPPTNLSTKVV